MDDQNTVFPKKVSAKECTDTGMALVLVCLLVYFFTDNRVSLLASISILVLNMVWSKAFSFFAKVWLGMSNLLGTVMSKAILTVIFAVVLTPIALLRRVLGHDPMRLKEWKAGTKSVLVVRDHKYSAEEIEQPF